MFKKLFIDSFKNAQWLKIAFGATILIFSVLLICYFLTDLTSTISVWVLALAVVVILGNWVSNVMVPRGKLKKSIPNKYKELWKTHDSKMSLESFTETYIHAKGLAFTVLALLPIIVIVIFIVL